MLLERVSERVLPGAAVERLLEPLGLADLSFYTRQPKRLPTAYWARDSRLEVLDPPDGVFASPPAFEAFGSACLDRLGLSGLW